MGQNAIGRDPLRIAIQVTVYVALYFATAYFFFGRLLLWIADTSPAR